MATTEPIQLTTTAPQLHPALDGVRRIAKHPMGAVFGTVIVVLILVAILAPALAPYDPIATSRAKMLPLSAAFPCGTDNIGRDQLSRIIWGSRISLYVGVMAVGIGTLGGTLLGLVSGFLGGKVDLIAQRAVDGMLAIPGIVLAMGIVSVLGSSTTLAANVSLYSKLPYDPVRDFAPVTMAFDKAYNMFLVHPSLPARNMNELIALARARPGQINYGEIGRAHV